ncbi:hypothetical protein L3V82_12490 [Thiotrichales bacterium 19S3-7]|nr:hypothetical protein [Thiotrichales bacterium 19S3-7]MCF6803009.1 hypothetical protein [Thiotrichales bacterium 19S3-11]
MNLNDSTQSPLAIFDTAEYTFQTDFIPYQVKNEEEYHYAKKFLKAYSRHVGTFNSYRREVERLLHWCWLIKHKPIKELTADDIYSYIHFCQSPPDHWVGFTKARRYLREGFKRVQNPIWRPFAIQLTRDEFKNIEQHKNKQFKLSDDSLKELIAILSTFYNFLLQKKYVKKNPMILLRYRFSLLPKTKNETVSRKNKVLNSKEIEKIIIHTKRLLSSNQFTIERAYFVLSMIYHLKVSVTELTVKQKVMPKMNHFIEDERGDWFFYTNNNRKLPVNQKALNALIRWRCYLGLSDLPDQSKQDDVPLIPKQRGFGAVATSTHIKRIIQESIDQTVDHLKESNQSQEAKLLESCTIKSVISGLHQHRNLII